MIMNEWACGKLFVMYWIIQIFIGIIMCSGIASAALASQSVETKSIVDRYRAGEMIRVLVVPGHDNDFVGAKFKKQRESEMTLDFARQLEQFLKQDPQLDVTVARDDRDYISELRNYFDQETIAVNEFIQSHARAMRQEIAQGSIKIPKQVPHGNAPKIPLYRLYAINRWAEQKFDIVIHIHFNDEGSRDIFRAGKYSGYAVYVPNSYLLDPEPSQRLGSYVSERLGRDFSPSTMIYEQTRKNENGVIPDMKLIALGANKTLSITRILIEYAYIYEPSVNVQNFARTSDVMAAATTYGVFDFLKQ